MGRLNNNLVGSAKQAQDEASKFIKNLAIIYKTTTLEDGVSGDRGEIHLANRQVLGKQVKIIPILFRGVMHAYEKGTDKAKKSITIPCTWSSDDFWKSRRADLFMAECEEYEYEIEKATDLLVYLPDINDYAVIKFKASALSDFMSILQAQEEENQEIIIEAYEVESKKEWHRFRIKEVLGVFEGELPLLDKTLAIYKK